MVKLFVVCLIVAFAVAECLPTTKSNGHKIKLVRKESLRSQAARQGLSLEGLKQLAVSNGKSITN